MATYLFGSDLGIVLPATAAIALALLCLCIMLLLSWRYGNMRLRYLVPLASALVLAPAAATVVWMTRHG